MAKIDLLRQIIREEVVKALRQELPKLISESVGKPSGMKNVIKEMKKSEIPMTLNTVETYQKNKSIQYSKSSPLNDLLTETAASMYDEHMDTMNFTTDDISSPAFFQPKDVAVGDVNGMLSTARPSSNLETIQINEVPDYSNLMKKMIDKGVM